jgi:hypothetical protein
MQLDIAVSRLPQITNLNWNLNIAKPDVDYLALFLGRLESAA